MVRVNNTRAIIAATLIVAISGIGVAVFTDESAAETSVIDMRGRNVTVPDDVNRVACMGAGSLRLVSYFEVDKVVGVDNKDANTSASNYEFASYRAAYDIKSKIDKQSLKNIGDPKSQSGNVNSLTNSGAQVIFTIDPDVNKLNNIQHVTGIPVVGLRAEVSFDLDAEEDFSKQIRLVGKVLKGEDRAEEIINYIQDLKSELKSLKSQVNASDFKKSYVGGLMTFMTGDLYKTTGKYLPFTWSVGKNVMPNMKNGGTYDTDIKRVVDSNPEMIFVDVSNYDACIKELKDKYEIFKYTLAVQNKDIFTLLPYKYYNTNYDCELINCFAVGSIIAPNIYPDISKKATEIFQTFFPGTTMTYEDYTEAIGYKIARIPASEYTP